MKYSVHIKHVTGLVVIIMGACALSVFAGTWTAPSTAPPNGNVDAPLNVGYGLQTKFGYLDIVGMVSSGVTNAYGLIIENGSVGIGTLTPVTKLEVVGGPIKATGGLIIETRTSDPSSPETGRMWLRTDL